MKYLGKIRDGKDLVTKEYVDARTKNGTISLTASWSGDGPYTQTVTVSGATVTEQSRVNLLLTDEQLDLIEADGVKSIRVNNNNGTLTASARGAAPTAAMTVQCEVTEVGA